jgi:exodeoxyribonuclease VII large subunit
MLKVLIDRSSRKARFSGESTFAAKDQLKSVFGARWLGAEKVWEASSFTDSVEELTEKLFDWELEVQELGELSVEAKAQKEVLKDIPKGLSVPQVIGSARLAIEERFKGGALVFGVISSLKSTANGRTFLTLSDLDDRTVSLNCVYWGELEKLNSQLVSFGIELGVDLEVMFQVDLTLNPKNGNLSARIVRVVPEYTLAKLQGEREKTNQRLKDEGVFENNKKLKLPFLPIKIGVLTSSTGTVIHDFRVVLEEAKFAFELFWLPVSVQGAQAKDEVVRGIKRLGQREDLDLIVLFRGGGSVSDLAVFNSYEVAKAIALCPLPILSAIGHQEDQSSAQDVSHLAFGVPRDLGSFLANKVIEVRNNIQAQITTLKSGLTQRLELLDLGLKRVSDSISAGSLRMIDRYGQKIIALKESMGIQSSGFINLLHERTQRLSRFIYSGCNHLLNLNIERVHAFSRMPKIAIQQLEIKEKSLVALSAHVADASPEVQLKRGYSIVRSASGGFIKSVSDVKVKDQLGVEFIDGEAKVEILKVEKRTSR